MAGCCVVLRLPDGAHGSPSAPAAGAGCWHCGTVACGIIPCGIIGHIMGWAGGAARTRSSRANITASVAASRSPHGLFGTVRAAEAAAGAATGSAAGSGSGAAAATGSGAAGVSSAGRSGAGSTITTSGTTGH